MNLLGFKGFEDDVGTILINADEIVTVTEVKGGEGGDFWILALKGFDDDVLVEPPTDRGPYWYFQERLKVIP